MADYDSPWKEALDEFFEPFLALLFVKAYRDIDWTRGYQSLDKELQQIVREGESGRRLVDKLLKVWLKSGAEQWILIHVEVQTDEDPEFAHRMYVYNYRLFDKYNRDVVSLAVLGDDNPRWRPAGFGYTRWGFEAGIRFPVAKLLDYGARRRELEESENPFALFVLAHLDTLETRRDQEERCDRKFRLIKRLYERGWAVEQVRRLFRVVDWMMDLPERLNELFSQQLAGLKEKKYMPYITTPERVALKQARREGLVRGIEAALKIRFSDAGLPLLPEIRQLDELDKLEAILSALESGAGLEELPRIWASQNP